MDNIFKKTVKRHSLFSWGRMGNIPEGRGSLGVDMPVLVYRLMQYTLQHSLTLHIGETKANHFFCEAGRLAGYEFAMNVLHLEQSFDAFAAELVQVFFDLRIGRLALEYYNAETGEMALTVESDLDCSGLEDSDECICKYDEGFLGGVMDAFTGQKYHFEEVECWSKGDHLCRFTGRILEKGAPFAR